MIQEQKPKLRPPLARPTPTPGKPHLNRPPRLRLLENFTAKPATPPPAATPPKEKNPPSPRYRQFFCRFCDRRITASLPPAGWLNLRRHIFRGTVAIPEGLSKRDQHTYQRRCSMGLGLFCSFECLDAAMPRLRELVRDLNRRRVGTRLLDPGEAPPAMVPHVQKGSPE
jgi:hypothetical protein